MRPRFILAAALAAMLLASAVFVGEGGAVGGTLLQCGNTTAGVGFGKFSPGLKNVEISQRFHAKLTLSDCAADSAQLANALPAKHGVPAAQASQINSAYIGVVLSMYGDCLVNGVTTAGDANTDNEYPLYGKVKVKWLNSAGGSIGGVPSSSAIVRADLEATYPPVLDFHGIVNSGLGVGSDISGSLELSQVVGGTELSDCFVNGDPGAIVTVVGAAATGNLSIALP